MTTIDGKRFTDKFTAINETDEDKVMMNLIYEMTAEALEYGIIDVDENYDAEHVREKVAVEYYVLESANRDISVKEWGSCRTKSYTTSVMEFLPIKAAVSIRDIMTYSYGMKAI